MAKGSLVNLTLDEIIAINRNKIIGKFGGGARGRTTIRRGTSRIAIRGRQIPVMKNLNRGTITARDGEKLCTVKISNLGPEVTTADLQELFAEHPYVDCAVHYDDVGNSMGTAVVFFQRFEEAMRLKRQFNGVKLDGKTMNMFAVSNDAGPRFVVQQSVPQFAIQRGRVTKRGTTNFPRFAGQKIAKNTSRNNMGGFRSPARAGIRKRTVDTRKAMTAEDLDRELESYMHGTKHPRISAP